MNPETKVIMKPPRVRKDNFYEATQTQVATVNNIVGLALSQLMTNDQQEESAIDKDNLITLLGDAGRLCADTF